MKKWILCVICVFNIICNYANTKTSGLVYSDVDNENNPTLSEVDLFSNVKKSRIVLSPKAPFATQLTQANAIYVIQYDFELYGDIVIPENCMLEFQGGRIKGDYAVDVEKAANKFFYASWFSIETLHKSIPYMRENTLYIDKDITLSSPITNRGSGKWLTGFAIKGLPTTSTRQENRAVINCDDCVAVELYGYRNTVSGITFNLFKQSDRTKPFVILDTSGDNNTDLDSRIYDCGFQYLNDYRNNMIITYGRGLSVYNCTFVGGIGDSNILCYMKSRGETEDDYSLTDEYGGRRFWFHHNTIHGGFSHFVHISKNADAPNCVFRGIRIENNNADLSNGLAKIDCKNIGTSISGNTFLGPIGRGDFIYCKDSHNLVINNNICIGGYITDSIAQTNNKGIFFASDGDEQMTNILITNNIVQVDKYFINATCNISNMTISGNMFTEESFKNTYNNSIFRGMGNCDKIILTYNSYNNQNGKTIAPVIVGNDDFPCIIKDIIVSKNVGIDSFIIPVYNRQNSNIDNWIIENISVDNFYPPKFASVPNDVRRSYFKMNVGVGFNYFDRMLNKPIWAKKVSGSGVVTWVDAHGNIVDPIGN